MLDLKFRLAMAARNQPLIMNLIGRKKEVPWNQARILRPDDDVLIDGFPRSANTFATYAFDAAQSVRLKVGNHSHSPAQFKIAARYNIPAMLVIRDPVPSVVSYMLYRPDIDARSGLMRYIAFHKPLHRLRDSFVVAPFDEIISDVGKSIDRLNHHFGTQFARFDHNEQSAQSILKKIDEDRRRRWQIENTIPPAPNLTKAQAQDMVEEPALKGLLEDAREQFALIHSNQLADIQ